MNTGDELPAAGHADPASPRQDESVAPVERIRRLLGSQPTAVLCTQGDGQPYGSLVAFAYSPDLRRVVFATSTATRKYRLLSGCERVALVVDSRPDNTDDLMKVEAITATGRARRVEAGEHLRRCSRMLTERHPYLKSFVTADSVAVFEIEILRYLHVSRFQEVTQWTPGAP